MSIQNTPCKVLAETILTQVITGFSVNKDTPTYKVEDPKKVLTIEEMNSYVTTHTHTPGWFFRYSLLIACRYDMYHDIEEKLAAIRGINYTDKFVCGLPVGLELPNGVIIGAAA